MTHFPEKNNDPTDPQRRLVSAFYENERKILLDLSNDITKIREKTDLITLFSQRIKSLFYFVHTIVTLIDDNREVYRPFLLDPAASPIRDHQEYDALVNTGFSLDEPFIRRVLEVDEPTTFLMEDVMDHPGSPRFLRVNYEKGIRQILMTPLKSKMQTIGFLHMYSDRTDSFTPEFKSIIKSIAPQISSAVSNIIKNEEVEKKEWVNETLLEIGEELAVVRSTKELAEAVRRSLRKINQLNGYIIRKINDDGVTMSTYIHDGSISTPDLTEVAGSRFLIDDGLQNRVLDSTIPMLFNIDAEMRRGISTKYIMFWKKMGFKTMAGIALRNGEVKLGILWLGIEEINLPLLQGICAQISVAMSNVIAVEGLMNQEEEKTFLLNFSTDIAKVRTENDLKAAIFKVLKTVLNIKLAMIQVIEDDGITLRPFMFDRSLFEKAVDNFDELVAATIDIHEPLTARVLASSEAVIFDVDAEIATGKNDPFVLLWKKIGYKYMYASALRAGNTDLGTLWLLTDEIKHGLQRGICAQISIAIANIQANEKLRAYRKMLEVENNQLKEQIKTIYNFSEIVGSGAEMQKVYHLMSLVSESSSTVLLLGETGTGKELIARAIHNTSPRKNKVMIKLNCAALPANLIESELFGHEKGAFTGAFERRIGKFELADNGTLFLDEIGEMPLEAQVKLLRVLQEKELERVGGKSTIKVNVRIIAATNRNLEEEVAAGRFRSDLYYRLNVFPIQLPPLRERLEDIAPLAYFFVDRYSKNTGKKIKAISPKVFQELNSYPWPGNVRELEHLIERSVLFATEPTLKEVHLPVKKENSSGDPRGVFTGTLEEIERMHIIETIKRCGGKLAGPGGAATYLDLPATTLHSKIKKLGITKREYLPD